MTEARRPYRQDLCGGALPGGARRRDRQCANDPRSVSVTGQRELSGRDFVGRVFLRH